MSDDPRGIFGRWSARKQLAKDGARRKSKAPDSDVTERSDAADAAQHRPGRMITEPLPAPNSEHITTLDAAIASDTASEGNGPGSGPPVAEIGDDPAVQIAVVDPDNGQVTEPQPAADEDDDLSKVDIEALDAESDYTRFMGQDVPDHIREKALAKLWASNPIFGAMDGLDDYAEDFNDASFAVANLGTDYKVGRGFLDDEDVAKWDELGAESKARAAQEQRQKQIANADIAVTVETPDQPRIAEFFEQSERYHAALYPMDSNHFTPLGELMAPHVRFVVARDKDKVVGCGALVLDDERRGEIKRMWVDVAARGLGIGGKIVAELERLARRENVTMLVLETGNKQPEAVGLYERYGFQECDAFGFYKPDPLSIFMQKKLV